MLGSVQQHPWRPKGNNYKMIFVKKHLQENNITNIQCRNKVTLIQGNMIRINEMVEEKKERMKREMKESRWRLKIQGLVQLTNS